jgi:hypothetical protein
LLTADHQAADKFRFSKHPENLLIPAINDLHTHALTFGIIQIKNLKGIFEIFHPGIFRFWIIILKDGILKNTFAQSLFWFKGIGVTGDFLVYCEISFET